MDDLRNKIIQDLKLLKILEDTGYRMGMKRMHNGGRSQSTIIVT